MKIILFFIIIKIIQNKAINTENGMEYLQKIIENQKFGNNINYPCMNIENLNSKEIKNCLDKIPIKLLNITNLKIKNGVIKQSLIEFL